MKGYIDLLGKGALEDKWYEKGKPYEDVKNASSIGKILEEEDVFVDVDKMPPSLSLLKLLSEEKVYGIGRMTDKGCHVMFINDECVSQIKTTNGAYTPIGIRIDLKTGSLGANNYECIKKDGKDRKIIYNPPTRDVLPFFLHPLINPSDHCKKLLGSCIGKVQNDNDELGRYETLLQLRLELYSHHGYSSRQVFYILYLINKYVYKEPIEEYRLNKLSNFGTLKPGGSNYLTALGGKVKKQTPLEFAPKFLQAFNVCKIDGLLSFYSDGAYIYDMEALEKKIMIMSNESFKDSERQEVIKYCNLMAPIKEKSDPRFICFKNGVFDLVTGQLLPHTPKVVLTNKIPHNYVKGAKSKLLENTFNNIACGNQDVLKLMYEIIGYNVYGDNTLSKFFILVGGGSNGKTTYLELLESVLGRNNYSSFQMDEISDKFNAMLKGKLSNIGDDLTDCYLDAKACGFLKRVVTSGEIVVEEKNKPKTTMKPYFKLIFSSNQLVRTADKSYGFLRRILILPFNAQFKDTDKDYNPSLKYELRDEAVIEALIYKSMQALQRILINKKFTECKEVQDKIEEFEEDNNIIVKFFKTKTVAEWQNGYQKSVIYKLYQKWCNENEVNPTSAIAFNKSFYSKYNFSCKRVKGADVMYFIP